MTRCATLFIRSSILAILLISGFSIQLLAQSGSIRLQGSVWDPSGTAFTGAALTAVNDKTGLQSTAVSDEDGYYVFPSLQPGTYTVTVKAKEFKDVVHRGISLFTPGAVSEDFSFEVSAIDKDISPTEATKINDSASSGSLSRKEIESLPLLNRDPLSLTIYQPGVQVNPSDPGNSSFNGARPSMNSVVMDGLSLTDPVQPRTDTALISITPDIITDIQIVTNGAKAEYGRSGGAQFVTNSRPGTKTWSGDFYDYFRNKFFDANEFFNNALNINRPTFTRNIFGATISGPAFGQKTLLFANFEGNRTKQSITRNRMVLTPEAKSGIFRWYAPGTDTIKTYDIKANDPRQLGIDPSVAAILAKLPAYNNKIIGDGLNTAGYAFKSPAYFDREALNLRLDHYMSPSQQIFFRFNWSHIDSTDLANRLDAAFPGEKSGTYGTKYFDIAAGSNWIVDPRMVNELRVGYIRPDFDYKRSARLNAPMFIANSWTNPLDPSFPWSYKAPVFEISDYLSQSKGRHHLRYGATFRRTTLSSVDYDGAYPNVSFGQTMGNAPALSIGPSGVSNISSADRGTFENLYNDLLGRVESVNQTFYSNLNSFSPAGTAKNRDFSSTEFAAFIQDDFKLFPNFTLNVGLRYELSTSPSEQNGLQNTLGQGASITPSANISNFSLSKSDSWYTRSANDFAPRAGFAWDPFGNGSTVLRGGYGIYYDRLIGAVTNFIDKNSYGLRKNVSVYPNAEGADLRLSDGIPVLAQPSSPVLQPPADRSSTIAILDPDLSTPRVDQFNLTLEKRLWGAVFELGYVGTRGRRLFQYVDLNQTKIGGDFLSAFNELREYRRSGAPISANNTLVRIFGTPIAAMNALGGSTIDTGQAGLAADTLDRIHYGKYAAANVSDFYIRNFPQFNQFLYGASSSKSWYDAFQFGIRKSTRNYNFRAYYTWSKSFDTLSADGGSFVSPADSMNPDKNKAPSDFDRTHNLNIAWNYAIPFGRTRSSDPDGSKVMNFLLGGWNVGTLWVWESGQRFSVYSGRQNNFAGVSSLANVSDRNIGNYYSQYGINYWFSPEQQDMFTHPDAGEISTSGRNSFQGPKYFNLDLLLQKKFYVGETQAVQFRLEAFNMLNKTRFSIPGNNINNSDFGIITNTVGTSRKIQLALRYQF